MLARGEIGLDDRRPAADLDGQKLAFEAVRRGGAVDPDLDQLEPLGVQLERPAMRPVAGHAQPRSHPGPLGAEIELQLDRGHEPVRRAIILAADGGGRRGGSVLDVEQEADLGAGEGGCNLP